ncbi:MAG TPA: putative toxin-antitoxin system toxin component, PIN family [Blastocatellia bacterium]|nr:putative toxin-antitoxin system toxin component, PIN family [Blastocatellia bacterium]
MSKTQLRVVLDTNVYISAALSPQGASGRVWMLGRQRRFQLITSPFIVNETGKVLRRLKRGTEQAVTKRLKSIARIAEIIQPAISLQVVRDPKDNPIIECAIDGNGDMIVSLDDDLLTLKVYNNIPILHVIDLLHILDE